MQDRQTDGNKEAYEYQLVCLTRQPDWKKHVRKGKSDMI